MKFIFSKRTLVKARKLIFPTDKVTTPQDHANAIMLTMSQYDTVNQSDILLILKQEMIKDREETIAELTIDLEKLRKI